MTTIPTQPPAGRRRLHSDQFKANAVALCMQPCISTAAVTMANGINSNLLRRWVREAEKGQVAARPAAVVATDSRPAAPSFVPVGLPPKSASAEVSIEHPHICGKRACKGCQCMVQEPVGSQIISTMGCARPA